MNKVNLMVIALCAMLLWVGTAEAKFPARPPLSCSERQTQAVQGLTDLLNLGQQLCTADLKAHSCETNVCLPEAFPATGQTIPYAAGDDGAIQAGSPLNYTDNGDGTITDNNTKLMWEQKDDDPDDDLHYVNNAYPWAGKCSGDNSTFCGTDADCSVAGGTCNVSGGGTTIFQWIAQLNTTPCFANHCDWRIPNIKELQSIVDYGSLTPAIDSEFGPTQSSLYWSATSLAGGYSSLGWGVDFTYGLVYEDTKTVKQNVYVRAVRSGS